MAQVTLAYRIFYALSHVPGFYNVMVWVRRVGMLKVRRLAANMVRRAAPRRWDRLGAPKESVSLFQALHEKPQQFEGRIVLDRQELTPMPPESICEILKATKGLRNEIYQPFPILWTQHHNARLVSRSLGLVLPGKKFAIESSYGRTALWAEPSNQYCWLPRATELRGNYTSIVSLWAPNHAVANFSHWLLDALPRLAILNEFPPDTIVLVPGMLAEYQRDSLRMLGLEGRIRPTPEQHLVVEQYFLSSPVSMVVCESAYTLKFLRDSFLPKASPNFRGPKRFVIDRKGVTRGVQNRDEFNAFFQKLGWEIIDTAALSFADEIKLFMDAEAYVGAIGSGFTNAVWSSPGCAVIQLLSEQVADASTEWICVRNQLRWRYLMCPYDSQQRVYADLKEVQRVIEELGLA